MDKRRRLFLYSNSLSAMNALISVSDKTGVAEFAAALVALGFNLLSTGGTAKLGFSVAVVPKANAPKKADKAFEGLTIHAVERVDEAMALVRGLD